MQRILAILLVLVSLTACNETNRTVGAACDRDADCRDRCLEGWPGGFCTVDCDVNADCPGGTICADMHGGVCLFLCDSGEECRDRLGDDDYRCDDRRNRGDGGDRDDVCVPD